MFSSKEHYWKVRAERAEKKLDEVKEALSTMVVYFGMDEDEWNKHIFDKAICALR
jgi:hypothetical protein